MPGSTETLADLPLRELLERVADRTPAPGGGSTIAVTCALAASLVEMAAQFTLARSDLAGRQDRMREVSARAAELRREALELADRDLDAYGPVLQAQRLASSDPERAARIDAARARAAEPPLALTRVGAELAELAAELARTGTPNLAGDAIAGALLAEAACRGAACLVGLNLAGFGDDAAGKGLDGYVRQAWQARLQALPGNADMNSNIN